VSKVGIARNVTNIDGVTNEDSTINEGRIFYDIIFRVRYPDSNGVYIGMCINLEAQKSYYPGYPLEMRGFFHAARSLSVQLKNINSETNYGCLQKVYSIWLCMGNVPNYEANTAILYHTKKNDIIGVVKRDPDIYDLMNVVILRINDNVTSEDDVLRLLQILCSSLLSAEQKLDLLEDFGIRMEDDVEGGIRNMCNLSDLVEERGIEKGLKEGRDSERQEIALQMLRDGMPYEKIIQYTQIPVETLRQWVRNQ